jgi:integrase
LRLRAIADQGPLLPGGRVRVDDGFAVEVPAFAALGGPQDPGAISDVWAAARNLALTPAQVASSLAGRPYDLRHAAVSLWLSAGVPPPRVAERAGHSVEVLLRVYAKCLDDGGDIANTRIDAALRSS